jgi:hypothetical protein
MHLEHLEQPEAVLAGLAEELADRKSAAVHSSINAAALQAPATAAAASGIAAGTARVPQGLPEATAAYAAQQQQWQLSKQRQLVNAAAARQCSHCQMCRW